jgi:PAS domain-containing protein
VRRKKKQNPPIRQRQQLPGTKDVHVSNVPIAQIEAFNRLRRTRHQLEGSDTKLARLQHEAFDLYLRSVDPATGRLRPAEAAAPVRTAILMPAGAVFSAAVRYASIEALRAAMDASGLMLWAATAAADNIHVSPALADYTGRPAAEFRKLGWTDMLPVEDRGPVFERAHTKFASGRPYWLLYRLKHNQHGYRPVIDYVQPVLIADVGSVSVGTVYEAVVLDTEAELPRPQIDPPIAAQSAAAPPLSALADLRADAMDYLSRDQVHSNVTML